MKYNGHKNIAFWNVSLWLRNDEGLWYLVRNAIESTSTLNDAAHSILNALTCCGEIAAKTPDGYAYNFTNIRAAIKGEKRS